MGLYFYDWIDGVVQSIQNGVVYLWDFGGRKILVRKDLKIERFVVKKLLFCYDKVYNGLKNGKWWVGVMRG